MTSPVRISLLGGFVVQVGDVAIGDSAWRLRKSRSVLKVLALAPGHAVHTERLQELLWPDRDPRAASNNLRQAVYHARRALGDSGADGAAILASRGDLLALAPEVELDVDRFETAAARAEASLDVADLAAAVDAYGGELLPEDAYEDWVTEPRRALAERNVRLLLAFAAARGPADAVDLLHRAIAIEPLNEEAHRALMHAYAATGRRSQALNQYEELRRTLERELAADPEQATRALYRELLAAAAPEPALAPGAQADVAQAAAGPAHNLPWQPTSFVGRRREIDELGRLLGMRRLVTLTGPGGCGKTRLALEVAREEAGRHPDGAWAIELAGIADAELVGQAVAQTLGLDLAPNEDPALELARHLAARDLLLVVDNCEHVLRACARLIETLLQRCPGVQVLATSREPLHLPGEVDWRVPSLSLSDPDSPEDATTPGVSDAIRLFCDRAATANPRFQLGPDNAASVAEICLRLDGLPLAIELAAARTGALSPVQIAERLDHGLGVLRAARSGGLTRHQTLQGTLDWSHDLLEEQERLLFRRLAVFAGGFELEAAEAVCPDSELDRESLLEVLTGLVDKSLVGVDDSAAAYRYRLLEPVRQYAATRLHEAGEASRFAGVHAGWFAQATDSPGGRVTDTDPRAVAELERDHDNLRAALSWTLQHQPPRALEIAAGMAGLWLLRAHLREGCDWLDRALAAAPEPTPARADALHARQALERRRPANYDFADRLSEERVGILHIRGDVRGECIALLDLSEAWLLRGHFPTSCELAERAAELADSLEDDGLRAAALERLGLAATWRHEFDAARSAFVEAIELYDRAAADERPASSVISVNCFLAEAGDPGEYPVMRFEETSLHFRRLPPAAARASVLSHLACLSRADARFADAREELESGLEIVRARGDQLEEARLLTQYGGLEARAGDLDAAEAWLGDGLQRRRRLRDHRGTLVTLTNLGVVANAGGDAERAVALLDQAERMAQQAVDGPGMGSVLLARAEIARVSGQPAAARDAVAEALTVFYAGTGFRHHTTWLRLQHAHLSLELGDVDDAERKLQLAREGFSESGTERGLVYCDALEGRLRAANSALTKRR